MTDPESWGERNVPAGGGVTESRGGGGSWSGVDVVVALGALVVCAFAGLILGSLGALLWRLGVWLWSSNSYGSSDPNALVYPIFGFVVGGAAFLVLLVVFRRGEPAARIAKATTLAMICSFLSGVAGVPIAKFDAARNRERDRQEAAVEAARYEEYHKLLKANPGVVLTEKWYQHSSDPESWIRLRVYQDSLDDPYVPYTPEILSGLLAAEENPLMKQKFLEDPRLDQQRLEEEFRSRLEVLTGGRAANRRLRGLQEQDGRNLIYILSVPRAKEEWFKEVAASGLTEGEAVEWRRHLREMIEERLKEQ